MPQKFRRAVFVVTYARTKNRIKYLVMKRKFHWRGWEFPKGGIEISESLDGAARREVIEETGKKPLKLRKFNFHGKYFYRKRFPERMEYIGQSFILYCAEIKFGKIIIDRREHSSYKWLNFEDSYKKLTHRNQKDSLNIVNEWLLRVLRE